MKILVYTNVALIACALVIAQSVYKLSICKRLFEVYVYLFCIFYTLETECFHNTKIYIEV